MNRLDTTDPQCVHTRNNTSLSSTCYICCFVRKRVENDKIACLLPKGPWIKQMSGMGRKKMSYNQRHSIAMHTFFGVQSKNDSILLQFFLPKRNSVWFPLSAGALGDRLNARRFRQALISNMFSVVSRLEQ